MITIEEFCDKYKACEDGRRWAIENCTSMVDAWEKLPPDWLVWVATREGVMTKEIKKSLVDHVCFLCSNYFPKDRFSALYWSVFQKTVADPKEIQEAIDWVQENEELVPLRWIKKDFGFSMKVSSVKAIVSAATDKIQEAVVGAWFCFAAEETARLDYAIEDMKKRMRAVKNPFCEE